MSNWLKPDGIEVAAIRSKYPVGTHIILDQMGPDPMPVEPGTKGTVTHVGHKVPRIEIRGLWT